MQDSELIRQPSKSKPDMFPLRLDTRIKRLLDPTASSQSSSQSSIFSNDDEEGSDFLSHLRNASTELLSNPLDYMSPTPQDVAASTAKPTQSETYRNFANIFQSTSAFMSPEDLAAIEQTGNQLNNELVNDPDYVDLRAYLGNKNRYKIDKDTQDQLDALEEETDSGSRGKGATLIHNASLFSKIGDSPFKKWDTETNETLTHDTGFQALQEGSLSPNQILNTLFPSFWKDITHSTQGFNRINPITYGQESSGEAAHLSIEDIPDPFSDTPRLADGSRSKFDVNPNFYTLLNSGYYKELPQDQKFAFITQAAEAKTRAMAMLRKMGGSIKHLFPDLTTAGKITDPETQKKQDAAAIATAHANATRWWETTGQNLSDTELLPFALFVDVLPTINKMSNWSNWQKGNPIGAAMVKDYLDFSHQKYITPLQTQTLSRNLLGNTTEKGNTMWDKLVKSGLIDTKGHVQKKFNPDDPNFKLNLGLTSEEDDHITLALTTTQLGKFAIQDQTNVNNAPRYDFKLKSTDGQYRSMSQALDLLKTGLTPKDRVENARIAYDYFMDMYSSLTQISITSPTGPSQGKVKSTPVQTRTKAELSPDAQWREKDSSGTWVTVKGPLSIEFNTQEQAETLKTSVHSAIALLEPLMSLFSPRKDENGKEISLRILTDNSINLVNGKPIKLGDPDYRINMDFDTPSDLLKSNTWKALHKDIATKITSKLGLAIPKIQIVNEGFKAKHTSDVKAYKEEREQIEQETIDTLTHENKVKAEQEAEEKKIEQERQAARKKEAAEDAAKQKARKEAEAAEAE